MSLLRDVLGVEEPEKLIEPSRNESNGYRDYSENDVENIKKIAYLRTLGISIEDIRSIISGKVTLQETLEKQNEVLKSQITDLNKAKLMCEKMLDEESISYEKENQMICYHCKCEKCGKLIHLQCNEVESLKQHMMEHHGFEMDSLRIVFYGICSECKKTQN